MTTFKRDGAGQPLTAQPYQFLRVWTVGAYRVTLTIPKVQPGQAVGAVIEWAPKLPERLTAEELADYRAGRDAALAAASQALGIRAAVVEV